ncbi:MAG: hypothetical protein FJW88_13595 [Actinobacteria bacterium]|nr:hypothetical protein [Actinomycetota bacterium]
MSRQILVVLVTGVLALAACSSDDVSDASGGDANDAKPAEVAPSKGCTGASAAEPVAHGKVTISSSGAERWYWQDVPPAHDGETPVPVVVDFHGYSEGADVHLQMSGLGDYGKEQGFVTITPQGQGAVPRWDPAPGSTDMVFVEDLLDQVGEQLCIDTNRVYSTGLSNGAMMTSAVACELADRFAAAAPVAGVQDPDGCDPARVVPAVAFHGTADEFVPYDGGYGDKAASLPSPDGSGKTLGESGALERARPERASVPEITAAWAKRNGCDTEPTETEVAPDVTRIAYDCPDGADVEFYRVDGGGHSWPGSAFSKSIENVVGPTTFSIAANEVMWDFFQRV